MGGVPWSLAYKRGLSLVLHLYNLSTILRAVIIIVTPLLKWEVVLVDGTLQTSTSIDSALNNT